MAHPSTESLADAQAISGDGGNKESKANNWAENTCQHFLAKAKHTHTQQVQYKHIPNLWKLSGNLGAQIHIKEGNH